MDEAEPRDENWALTNDIVGLRHAIEAGSSMFAAGEDFNEVKAMQAYRSLLAELAHMQRVNGTAE